MTPVLLRSLVQVHRWLGLALALPLLAIVLSGALLLFKDTLWVPGEWRSSTLSVAQSDAALARFLADDAAWLFVDVARPGRAFHVVGYADEHERPLRVGATATEVPPTRLAVAETLFALHTRLLAGEAGKWLIRVLGPLAVVSLLLGFLAWWPRRRGWRSRDLRPDSLARPGLLRLHLAWGAAALVVLLPLLLSGALLAHNPTLRAWLRPLGPVAAPLSEDIAERRFVPGDPAEAISAARGLWPKGRLTQLSRRAAGSSEITLKFQLSGERHPNGRSTITLDLDSGRVVGLRDARLGGLPAAYDDFLYGFHIAHLGGVLQAWLWLASALALLALIASGTVAWLRKRRRGRVGS
jgi:uncharacterized iron-regulated membrane protein